MLRVSFVLAVLLLGGRPAAAGSDWDARLGMFLGPQYFLEEESQVQFSFGAEGQISLLGPLSVGLSAGMGVIADTTVVSVAGLRLHLLRHRELSLALDVRGGATILISGEEGQVQPLVVGGLELVHDLGDMFCILVRTGTGYQGGADRGWLLDLVVGLGIFL
jgi:hypothetical protein